MLRSAVQAVVRILSYDMLRSARLPVDYPVEDLLLLCAASVKVDTGGLNALMSKNIGKHSNIAAPFNEIFCEQMSERMRMKNGRVEIVEDCEVAQLHADAVG